MPNTLPEPLSDELAFSQRLVAVLREEIAANGPISFARYMERCLYTPGLGYYSAGRTKFGADGDFVTAPELGGIFARCMVNAMLPTLRELGAGADILELGGGSGAFAESVLLALADLDALPNRYLILEPSADLQQRQRDRLRAALPTALLARVHWVQRPPENDWEGLLFANEVIDALPVTRFSLREGDVFEVHVSIDGDGQFAMTDRPADALVSSSVRHLERDLKRSFADGYRSEVLPQLPYWIQAIAGSLRRGAMWFVDYGYPRREFYHPDRRDGTLIAHYRHRAHDDALLYPGLQDLSASVDFTALAEAGNSAGFALAAYLSQAHLLIATGLAQVHAEAVAACVDAAATYAVGQQIKRLTLPDQMGERFQAMLLVRDLPASALPAAVLAASQGRRL